MEMVSPVSSPQPWHLLDVGEAKDLQQPPQSGWHIPSTKGARKLWGSALVLGVTPWKAFLSLPSRPVCLPRRLRSSRDVWKGLQNRGYQGGAAIHRPGSGAFGDASKQDLLMMQLDETINSDKPTSLGTQLLISAAWGEQGWMRWGESPALL